VSFVGGIVIVSYHWKITTQPLNVYNDVQSNWNWLIWQLKIVKGVDRKKKRLSNTLLSLILELLRRHKVWRLYKKILHKYYKVVTVGKLFEYYKNVVPTNGKLTNLNHISSVDLTENSTTERSSV
jgi:hypothetical protein